MTLLYGVTIFVSAVLLFSVQPMVGKMTLPSLGGTPAVWNTCMVFFQAALLAGYAYAHGTVRWLGVRRQAALHMVVLLVPLLVLPITLSADAKPPRDGSPAFWLLGRLGMSVALPFFVVSTGAPLLQLWFANTGRRGAKDPYFLYAASNLGSLLALLAYPVLIERSLELDAQTMLWTGGYVALIVLAFACAAVMWRAPAEARIVLTGDSCDADDETAVTMKRRLWWVALAFVPSSLMLGVTAHITTDVAAVPLFWVIPLALYLLTFVFVFARRNPLPVRWMTWILPYVFLPVALLTFSTFRWLGLMTIPVHLAAFFVAAMVCHGELARTRPAARRLTEFFLLMSVGGVLGGVFNGLVAPMVFDGVLEYPLAMVLACLLRPGKAESRKQKVESRKQKVENRFSWLDVGLPAALGVVVIIVVMARDALGLTQSRLGVALVFGVPAFICFAFKERPIRFALGFGVVMLTAGLYANPKVGEVLYAKRNFFGVKRVVLDADGKFYRLYHGSTTHGIQNADPAKREAPLSYYHRSGPLGDVFKVFGGPGGMSPVCVIGLGTGSMAAYVERGQRFTFLEIDPAVERIARDTRFFTYLDRCRGDFDVLLGDGRLTLADFPDGSFEMLILDAFSSDAIPTHLLSREALEIYLSKLTAGGVLAFHVSNRHLKLEPMVAQLAADAGLACLSRHDTKLTADELADGRTQSHWMLMARRPELIARLVDEFGWYVPRIPPGTPVWTDQYCDLLSLFDFS